MAYRIRNEGDTSTLLTLDDEYNALVNIVYSDGKTYWVKNKIPQRQGTIRHFMGRDDDKISLTIQQSGGSRFANYKIIDDLRKAGTVIYLDVDDYNSNWSGKYVIIGFSIKKNNGPYAWDAVLVLEEYNN